MLLKLLFCVNCQTTIAYRVDHSLYFHHLWVLYTVNYIIPSHMWVLHTVRNVGSPHLWFSFLVGPPPSFLCNRSYQNPDNFKSRRSLFHPLVGPPHNELYYSPSRVGPPHCEKCGSVDVAVVIRATKIWKALCFPSTIGVDNVAFRSYQKPVNSESWRSCQT